MNDREPQRPVGRQDNAFDTMDGYSGEDYHRDRELAEGARHPSGAVSPLNEPPSREDVGEAGQRASVDPATGAVHGSGAGAGGGNAAEDFDSDPQGGGGYPRTGARGEGAAMDGKREE